ncbi:MAG: serine--tRNA ligase, partial [Enterococcus sp.]
MLDVKMIRNNFAEVSEKLATRGVKEEVLKRFLDLDEQRRQLLVKTEELKKYRNDVSGEIAKLKREKNDATDKIAEMKEVGVKIKDFDTQVAEIDDQLTEITTTLPNLPHDSVPIGEDEDDNVEIRRWSTPRQFAFEPKPHWEVAENLDILDFERGAKVSGSRFVYYK